MAGERNRPPAPFMNPRPRLNAEFLWECPVCRRPYRSPQRAADCACPAKKPLTVAAPLVRCSELPMFDGHALALTGWLEADQAELARAAPPGRRRGVAGHRLPLLRLARRPGAHRRFCVCARLTRPPARSRVGTAHFGFGGLLTL